LAMKNGGPAVWEAMLGMVESVDSALAKVENTLPNNFPARTWNAISAGIKSGAKRFLTEADAVTTRDSHGR
jgi:serine/threonine-protein kinase HipA